MSTAQETAADTGHSVKAATEYVVLQTFPGHPGGVVEARDEVTNSTTVDLPAFPDGGWKIVAKVSARTAEAAIRQYAERSGSTTTLTLAAVASRYWVTATLKPSTVTTWEATG